MVARLKREKRERETQLKTVKEEVVVEQGYKHFDHPAIIRSGK
jgi:hypothetical protein